ncbi:DUF397 domain-containing protein [Streptomyces longwoodensis]|uniref:DUF397 domain-containing protein n=1 Tax=Streptomyces longwoodensis TaxID=68231 RepID=UPI0036F79F47
MSSLYDLPVDPAAASYTRACGGNLTSDNEACFQLAELPGAQTAAVLVGDSKNPAAAPLRMTVDEVDALVAAWPAMRDRYTA